MDLGAEVVPELQGVATGCGNPGARAALLADLGRHVGALALEGDVDAARAVLELVATLRALGTRREADAPALRELVERAPVATSSPTSPTSPASVVSIDVARRKP